MNLKEAVLNVSSNIHEVGDILLYCEYGRKPYVSYFFKVIEKISNGGYMVKRYRSGDGCPICPSYSEKYVPSRNKEVFFSRAPKESYEHIEHLKNG